MLLSFLSTNSSEPVSSIAVPSYPDPLVYTFNVIFKFVKLF